MSNQAEIQTLLQNFQQGYRLRDLSRLDDFMNLFCEDVEIIGTNGIRPGNNEWYPNRATARDLIRGDWETWGDLRLELDAASIHIRGETAWVALPATVTQAIGDENYAAYLQFIKEYLEKPGVSAKEKLHYILRGGTNTLYELHRGERFTWPLRFTAIAIKTPAGWQFAQIHFSFPTIYFPDVRIIE